MTNGELQLNDSKKTTLAILNMFDPNILHSINGECIDKPTNAITLRHDFHIMFGDFQIFFDPIEDQPHTYKIDSTETVDSLRLPIFPITRALHLTHEHTIDPPSPQLLVFHSACVTILQMSGAGEYIDKILEDLDETIVKADGSSDLGRIVTLTIGGWLDHVSVH
ncbi:MAG: hypothetical protein M1834_002651 [Cirrosporium novae-zelandiae]|nr:MAG: hypothetical protein M1834_002651 [Cirrosporium novae-zelandiae]